MEDSAKANKQMPPGTPVDNLVSIKFEYAEINSRLASFHSKLRASGIVVISEKWMQDHLLKLKPGVSFKELEEVIDTLDTYVELRCDENSTKTHQLGLAAIPETAGPQYQRYEDHVNSIEYLAKYATVDDKIKRCYERLRQMGVSDISRLHKNGTVAFVGDDEEAFQLLVNFLQEEETRYLTVGGTPLNTSIESTEQNEVEKCTPMMTESASRMATESGRPGKKRQRQDDSPCSIASSNTDPDLLSSVLRENETLARKNEELSSKLEAVEIENVQIKARLDRLEALERKFPEIQSTNERLTLELREVNGLIAAKNHQIEECNSILSSYKEQLKEYANELDKYRKMQGIVPILSQNEHREDIRGLSPQAACGDDSISISWADQMHRESTATSAANRQTQGTDTGTGWRSQSDQRGGVNLTPFFTTTRRSISRQNSRTAGLGSPRARVSRQNSSTSGNGPDLSREQLDTPNQYTGFLSQIEKMINSAIDRRLGPAGKPNRGGNNASVMKRTYSDVVNRQPSPVALVRQNESARHREEFPSLRSSYSGSRGPHIIDGGPVWGTRILGKTGNRTYVEPDNMQTVNQTKNKRGNSLLILHKRGENAFAALRQTQGVQHRWISHHFTYQSGAVLIICRDMETVEKIRVKLINHPDIEVKCDNRREPEVRVHNIQMDYPIEELQQDIAERFGERAKKIDLVRYQKNPQTGFAVLQVSEDLHNKMSTVRTMRVDWEPKRISTSIFVPRCPKCHLLGHKEKHCGAKEGDINETGQSEPCADCTNYNTRVNEGMRRRVDHVTGFIGCATLQAFKRKWTH